jgi:cell division inhibitor SepF
MPGVLRKTMVYLGLVEHDEDGYDDELLEPEPEPAGVRRMGAADDARSRSYAETRESRGALALRPDPAPRVETAPAPEVPAYRITTFVPTNYNDARSIGEHFRQGVPVIMNISDMDERDAKRLVDFAAGLTFGLHGSLERVTNRVFLLSPSNIEVSAEDKARIRESGFFNQS